MAVGRGTRVRVVLAAAARRAPPGGVGVVRAGRPGHARTGDAECGVAALVADSFVAAGGRAGPWWRSPRSRSPWTRWTDGWRGDRDRVGVRCRLDGEADAFLMLVLSVYVARRSARGCWRSGLARYAFALAAGCCPGCARAAAALLAQGRDRVAGIALTVAARTSHCGRRTPPWRSRSSCWPSRSAGTSAGCGAPVAAGTSASPRSGVRSRSASP